MVPDKFNMVDMDGIDLIMMQGEEVPGLYNRLVESIAQCRYQCLYNWFFDGVVIPPSYVEMEVGENEEVTINDGITVTPDDVIHIYSIAPGPVDPEIIPLLAEENGVYTVPTGKDGFNPVTVDVPSYTPVINSLSITENGTYTAPSGVDGYSPVTVDVPSYTPVISQITITENGTYTAPSGVDGYSPVVVNVGQGTRYTAYHILTVSATGSYAAVSSQKGIYDFNASTPFSPSENPVTYNFAGGVYAENHIDDIFSLDSYVNSSWNWGVQGISGHTIYLLNDGVYASGVRAKVWYYNVSVDFYIIVGIPQ